jgi:hypothetical protein
MPSNALGGGGHPRFAAARAPADLARRDSRFDSGPRRPLWDRGRGIGFITGPARWDVAPGIFRDAGGRFRDREPPTSTPLLRERARTARSQRTVSRAVSPPESCARPDSPRLAEASSPLIASSASSRRPRVWTGATRGLIHSGALETESCPALAARASVRSGPPTTNWLGARRDRLHDARRSACDHDSAIACAVHGAPRGCTAAPTGAWDAFYAGRRT